MQRNMPQKSSRALCGMLHPSTYDNAVCERCPRNQHAQLQRRCTSMYSALGLRLKIKLSYGFSDSRNTGMQEHLDIHCWDVLETCYRDRACCVLQWLPFQASSDWWLWSWQVLLTASICSKYCFLDKLEGQINGVLCMGEGMKNVITEHWNLTNM